jgi:hypothetical protein
MMRGLEYFEVGEANVNKNAIRTATDRGDRRKRLRRYNFEIKNAPSRN